MKIIRLVGVASILLAASSSDAKPVLEGKYGAFSHYSDSDAITDDDTSFVTTEAEEGSGNFIWKCFDGQLYAIISIGGQYYKPGQAYSAIYRFDKNKPENTKNWLGSQENNSLFLNDDLVEDFTKTALVSKSLAIRSTDESSDEETVVFNLNGLKSALDNLSCYK